MPVIRRIRIDPSNNIGIGTIFLHIV